MSGENTLRQKVREAIQAGKIPDRRPDRMWGGPGTGVPCIICDEAVDRDGVGFELEFAREGDHLRLRNCPVHVLCFEAWELERSGPNSVVLPERSNDGTIVACGCDTTHKREPA